MAARPSGRTSTMSHPPTPHAPRVRDFSRPRGAGVAIEWDVRTLYDFVFSLSSEAGGTDDLPAPDRVWLEAARATLAREQGDAVEMYASDMCVVLAGLAVDRPAIRTAADLVALVADTNPGAMLRTIFADDLRNPDTSDVAARAIAGDAQAQAALVDSVARGHDERRSSLTQLLADPTAMANRARGVLETWLPRFQEIEPRVARIIRRDVDARAGDAASLTSSELIERTTGGIRWLSEPGIRRVILAPSYFSRPYNFLLGGDGWRLFGYPVADTALDPADPMAPPQSVVRLHRALGDETRLRILRLLRDRDLYLTEIATALDLSKPTIKHHLAQLRSAGLVTLTEEGGLSYYSLRRVRLDDASVELKRFLVD